MPAAKTIDELKKHITIVHSRRVSASVVCHIAQARGEVTSYVLKQPVTRKFDRPRSQYLCLVIETRSSGRFVVLKLSTFRKIVRWVTKKGWGEARRLSAAERLLMNARDWISDNLKL